VDLRSTKNTSASGLPLVRAKAKSSSPHELERLKSRVTETYATVTYRVQLTWTDRRASYCRDCCVVKIFHTLRYVTLPVIKAPVIYLLDIKRLQD
jgi:hypothetical protein